MKQARVSNTKGPSDKYIYYEYLVKHFKRIEKFAVKGISFPCKETFQEQKDFKGFSLEQSDSQENCTRFLGSDLPHIGRLLISQKVS